MKVVKSYYTYRELIDEIDEPNRSKCIKIYEDNQEIFDKAAGSTHNHQAWQGGYIGHMTEVLNIAAFMYRQFSKVRELPFSLSDALLVLFLHDLEKPWKYGGKPEEVEKYPSYQDFQKAMIKMYGFELTDDHWNGIKYAHGEGEDFQKMERVSCPLAAFIHCCDTVSARIWFDYPKDGKYGW